MATNYDIDREVLERNRAAAAVPERDGEFTCDVCGRRCTRGPSGTEYGHAKGSARRDADGDCPRRPDDVDPAPQGGEDA